MFSVGLIQGWAIIIILNSDTLQISSLPSATISSNPLTHSLKISWLSAKKVFLLLLISKIHAQHTIFVIFPPHLFTLPRVSPPCKNEKGLWEWEKIRLNFNIYNFGKYQDIGALSRTLLSIWWIQPPTAIASMEWEVLCYILNDFDLLFSFYLLKRHEIFVRWEVSKQAPNATLLSSCFPL